jgi:NAD-dependent SIR2 family protein deacetylase
MHEEPFCTCGECEWSFEQSYIDSERELSVLQCADCGRYTVQHAAHDEQATEYIGSANL